MSVCVCVWVCIFFRDLWAVDEINAHYHQAAACIIFTINNISTFVDIVRREMFICLFICRCVCVFCSLSFAFNFFLCIRVDSLTFCSNFMSRFEIIFTWLQQGSVWNISKLNEYPKWSYSLVDHFKQIATFTVVLQNVEVEIDFEPKALVTYSNNS